MSKEAIMRHPCVKCEMVRWKFPHPIYVCGVDEHEAISIVGLEQALDNLYEDCPKPNLEDVKLDELLSKTSYDY